MHGVSGTALVRANTVAVRPASETTITVQTESDYCQTFKRAARQLLGSDPGLELAVLTGISDSSGYRYVSGERPATGYIVWQLLRSEHGWQWLSGLMEGSDCEWWLETKRARAIKEAIDGI